MKTRWIAGSILGLTALCGQAAYAQEAGKRCYVVNFHQSSGEQNVINVKTSRNIDPATATAFLQNKPAVNAMADQQLAKHPELTQQIENYRAQYNDATLDQISQVECTPDFQPTFGN